MKLSIWFSFRPCWWVFQSKPNTNILKLTNQLKLTLSVYETWAVSSQYVSICLVLVSAFLEQKINRIGKKNKNCKHIWVHQCGGSKRMKRLAVLVLCYKWSIFPVSGWILDRKNVWFTLKKREAGWGGAGKAQKSVNDREKQESEIMRGLSL